MNNLSPIDEAKLNHPDNIKGINRMLAAENSRLQSENDQLRERYERLKAMIKALDEWFADTPASC